LRKQNYLFYDSFWSRNVNMLNGKKGQKITKRRGRTFQKNKFQVERSRTDSVIVNFGKPKKKVGKIRKRIQQKCG